MNEETKKVVELYERLLEEQQKVVEGLVRIIKNPCIVVTDEKGKVIKTINQLDYFREG